MKKQNFKKIVSTVLAVMMISSIFAMAIPVSAAENFPKQLATNENVVVNGVTYRFDRLSQNSDSKAVVNPDNTITLTMKQGDLFWIPSVTIGNDSVLNMKVTLDSSNNGKNKSQIACGLAYNIDAGSNGTWGESSDSLNVLNIQTKCRARLGNGTVTKMSGGSLASTFTSKDFSSSVPEAAYGVYTSSKVWQTGKMLEMNLQLDNGTDVVASFRNSDGAEFVSLSYAVGSEPKVFEGPVGFGVNWSGDGSDAGYLQVTINSFEITNAVVNGTKTNFSLSSSLTYADTVGVIFPMRLTKNELDFDGEYGFVDLGFSIDETVSSDTEFVVKKNGEVVDRKALSTFTPVDGSYSYFTYFTGIQETDVLTVCLEKDNAVLERSSYDVEYGKAYKKYMTNPDPAKASELTVVSYSEDFSATIELVPGVNIVNGHKWTYIKNSTDGSAVIRDGKLYFVGSNYDMILFDDVDVDNQPYKMEYEMTYLNTPADDDWSAWNCWFGGLFHLSDADADGNKSAFITSVTPNDVYMLDGKFDANGVFTQVDETSDHVTFVNSPSSPTQGSNCYYWNERAGNGIPVKVRTYMGSADYDNGGLGMSGYTAQGTHVISSNLPGAIPAADRKVGAVGFVCSESQVSVIIDNLSITVKGKNITVDGAQVKVSATEPVDVAQFKKSDKQFIYANVDGEAKYAGDLITATRLTQITTTQVAISTGKVAAVGQTGLKWTSQISKADYEALTSDANISKVEVGTAVVLTTNAAGGITIENAASNIAGTATLDGDNYVFEGVLDIAKEARDTSYSGVGYIKITMKDGNVIVAYADYVARQHAYALSDLVDEFVDDEPVDTDGNTDTTVTDSTNTDSNDATTDGNTTEEESGCGSSVAGLGVVICATLAVACVPMMKKKENNG